MNEPILRLTDAGRTKLLEIADESPDLWLNPDTDFDAELKKRGIADYAEETGAVSNGKIALPTGEGYAVRGGGRPEMDRSAPALRDILRNLPARQAEDGRVWEWLTHFRLHRYCCERWPGVRNDKKEHIELHWFVRNRNRNMYQDNTASRTYWVGEVAERAALASNGSLTRERVATHLGENPITYHNIMQSSMTHNPRMAALVLEALMTPGRGSVMGDDGETAAGSADDARTGVSSRGSINLWKRLNLAAGKILPEAMSDHDWNAIIDDLLDEVMRVPEFVKGRRDLRGVKPYRVLSLGAGAQSTVMALMAESGEFGLEKPDIAIFADTGWEPPAVYEHLAWLKEQVSFEIRVVSAGDIKENLKKGVMPDGSKFIGIPVFLQKSDGEPGLMRRQCTTQYKLKPIHQELRSIFELNPRQPVPKGVRVEMWIGISVDEAARAKPSREDWIRKRFPLMDLGFSRAQLHLWFQERYPDRTLPKSACIGCPYHSDGVWKDLKENAPESFMEAVEVDIDLRSNPNITALTPNAKAYLHRSRKPLALVDFDGVKGYQDLMDDECEGLCGV